MDNRTKIIATLGPSSSSEHTIEEMVQAGLDVVRLNFSHGTYSDFERMVKTVRKVSAKLKKPIAILQDLSGPKVRTGELPKEGIALKKNERIFLSSEKKKAEKNTHGDWMIPVSYTPLKKDTKANDRILMDDGLIEIKIMSTKTLECRVTVPGTLFSHKGVNFPTSSLSAPPLTRKDLKDVQFGISLGVDLVALSFVRSAKDIAHLRKYLERAKNRPWIIAKIERHEAVKNLEDIVKAADGIMVARGDLGIEIPAEQVPIVQKKCIQLGLAHGKPVIIATQILQSMVKNPRASRAEISDAANAVLDFADALMLSNETAVGDYPVEAVKTLRDVARAIEIDLFRHPHLLSALAPGTSTTDATCLSAAQLAQDLKAKFLCAITKTGYTALQLAKHRPMAPIIAFTEDAHVAGKLPLVWGVTAVFTERVSMKSPFHDVRRILLQAGKAKKQDEVVICNSKTNPNLKLITTGKI